MDLRTTFSRRSFLRTGALTAGATLLPTLVARDRRAAASPMTMTSDRLLFVIAASGGASIIDSFLPISESETTVPNAPAYPDELIIQPPGSRIRTVRNVIGTELAEPFGNGYELSNFLVRHGEDLLVLAHDCTSVNHLVGQQRAMNGNGLDRGRTLTEAMAMAYGSDFSLPNCALARGGFTYPGIDDDVPARARAEAVMEPLMLALNMHGSRGILEAPRGDLISWARQIRGELELASPRAAHFAGSPRIKRYRQRRDAETLSLESADLVTKLMLLQADPDKPLADYGLAPSRDANLMLEHLPNLARGDAFEAQTAVAFLLARYGVSCAFSLGVSNVPSFLPDGKIVDTPLAFDFSHTNHIPAQQIMWGRVMQVVDGLITLLKSQDYLGDPALGKMWDRSLIYIATEFGRSKERPPGGLNFEFGTGHDLNNGTVLISPLLQGNQVFGGVDPDTGLTYGFDPVSGAPERGTVMNEGHVYSAICQALGVEFPSRFDMSALMRA